MIVQVLYSIWETPSEAYCNLLWVEGAHVVPQREPGQYLKTGSPCAKNKSVLWLAVWMWFCEDVNNDSFNTGSNFWNSLFWSLCTGKIQLLNFMQKADVKQTEAEPEQTYCNSKLTAHFMELWFIFFILFAFSNGWGAMRAMAISPCLQPQRAW